MNLNDLLKEHDIDIRQVLVLRHRPKEPKLNRKISTLAAENPDMFNAYQRTQAPKLERAMLGAKYVASFIGHTAGQAMFIGLYAIGTSTPLTYEEYWHVPEHIEMRDKFGMVGFRGEDEGRSSVLRFDLALTDVLVSWKGKLIVKWPPPEISWWRRAHNNEMQVLAILEESALDRSMPKWYEIDLPWEDLESLPNSWKSKLSEWRAIYYIFDASDGKGYVGSAYGSNNLLGRWKNYAVSGHGGNSLLRDRDPKNFRFSILQRVSPDMDKEDVIQLETAWKTRLHTRSPSGLNDN